MQSDSFSRYALDSELARLSTYGAQEKRQIRAANPTERIHLIYYKYKPELKKMILLTFIFITLYYLSMSWLPATTPTIMLCP